MISRFRKWVALAMFLCLYALFTNYASDPPNGYTNAPFDHYCSECHNPSSILNGTVTLTGIPSMADPGQTYNVTLRVDGTLGSPVTGGFQLVSVYSANNANAGDLKSTSADVGTGNTGGREYVEHRGIKSFNNNSVSWSFDWQAPANPTSNEITMYYAANITNGNNRDNGDKPVSGSYSFPIQSLIQPLVAGIVSQKNVSCNGLADGSLSVMASGGSTPYQYQWSNGGENAVIQNLPSGIYQVTVTDADGNNTVVNATITEPNPIVVALTVQEPLCNGTNSGSISTMSSGGTLPYRYLWSNGLTTSGINNLSMGNYQVTLTDANGCISSSIANLNIRDTVGPQLVLKNITVYPDPDGHVPVVLDSVIDQVLDECGIDSIWIENAELPSCTSVQETLTLRALDVNGNLSQGIFILTVQDTTPPTMICPGNLVSSDPQVNFTEPTASDNCQLASIAQLEGLSSGSIFPEGINALSFRAMDLAGNSSICNFSITVNTTTSFTVSSVIIPLNIRPNPFSDALRIEWEAAADGDVEISLYDMQTRMVFYQIVSASQGKRNLILATDNIPSGVYSLKVQQHNKYSIKKVVKL